MDDRKTNILYSDITDSVLNSFYKVYNSLGYGFLEKVYENSLTLELRKKNLVIEQQHPIKVYYDNEVVGEYFADLLVDNKIIVELKAVKSLTKENEYQLII